MLRVLSYLIVGCIYETMFVIYLDTEGMFLRGDISYGPRIMPGYSVRSCTSLWCEAFLLWPPARLPFFYGTLYYIYDTPYIFLLYPRSTGKDP